MSTTSPAQRQAASRARKKAAGFTRITLRFDAETAARLRRLTKRDGSPQATVVAAALALFDDKKLLADIMAWAAAQRAAKAAAEQAQ
ncbi:hypothetical protein [Bradyrhizobium sp. USDA 3364]